MSDALRSDILEGRLRPGAFLPSTRELARTYKLARGTIVSAFEQLRAEGYVSGSIGSGTFVSKVLPDELLQVPKSKNAAQASRASARVQLAKFASRARAFPAYNLRPARAFRANQPALDLFPTTLWAQTASRRARKATTNMLHGCPPFGYRPLQDAVADYLTTSRGVRCIPEQIAIVAGVQEALALSVSVVLNPGERVCIENPGYIGATLVCEAFGAELVSVDVDGEGMRLPDPRTRRVKLAYVTPAHQYPSGVVMSLTRRLALLDWARRVGALIFEDDYDGEYRYAGRPVPALQGLDRQHVVLFAGSFSKVLFPSLRLGYVVVPEWLVEPFAAAISLTTRHAPLLEQAILADFMADGHFGRHVRRMREVYAERRAVLLEAAEQHLSGLLEISGVEAGLQTAAWLRRGVSGSAVATAAAKRDVEVASLGRYFKRPPEPDGLQIGFAAVDTLEIRRGVRELAQVLEQESRPMRRQLR